ncbi:hypothetical protein RB195_007829 [Necator americanus]|uniref:Uncharacterized protein n=1 Tax=Necator americanus TaxID=51031 RepID=A0ABR1C2H4_NECAM
MPRFQDKRTFELLREVPPNMFFLVREALPLRQKVELQLRTLQRRIEDMENAKISTEMALETFPRALSFMENEPKATGLMDGFDIY